MTRPAPVAALVLGALLLASGCGTPAGGGICSARRADLVVTVEATGNLKSEESASIGPPSIPEIWGYKILWMVPEGRNVRKGEPVVMFDTAGMDQEAQKKRAERDQAAKEMEKQQLEMEKALLDLDGQLGEAKARQRRIRLKLEVPGELVAGKELAKDRLDLEAADEEVRSLGEQRRLLEESGKAQSELLQRRRDRSAERVRVLEQGMGAMRVTAPRNGIVVYVGEMGREKRRPGDTVYRLEKFLEIPDLDRMGGVAEIAEADAGKIRVGQEVRLRMEAYPDRPIAGRVTEISPSIRRESWNTPLKVRTATLRLEGARAEWMRPGMRFRAEFEVDRVTSALLIPLEAVLSRPGGPAVRIVEGLGDRETPVRLGKRNQTEVEVLSGLREGERIRREPAEALAGEATRGAW
jgi:HlyD family secretion protein